MSETFVLIHRVAVQRQADQRNQALRWQWKSTVLSSLQSLFLFLRRYGALQSDDLRVFTSSSREGLEEQLEQENRGTSLGMVSMAVLSQEPWNERGRGGSAVESRSALERQREELELGPAGDHDMTYRFVLPASMPQVLAWMRLLARIQRGELES